MRKLHTKCVTHNSARVPDKIMSICFIVTETNH